MSPDCPQKGGFLAYAPSRKFQLKTDFKGESGTRQRRNWRAMGVFRKAGDAGIFGQVSTHALPFLMEKPLLIF